MKKLIFVILFTWFGISILAQGYVVKEFYAPDKNYIGVVTSFQAGAPRADNATILIISDTITLKGTLRNYEANSPVCYFVYGDITFQDSVYIKITHPDFQTFEKKIAAKEFSGKKMITLKKRVVK